MLEEIGEIVACHRFNPSAFGSLAIAPFDVIADFLRGTKRVILDMYRCPDKLMEAVDRITGLTIKRIISTLNATGGFTASFPLHKGDDTFMSRKQFEKFYWPSLKKVMDALIEEGISVHLFAEGAYDGNCGHPLFENSRKTMGVQYYAYYAGGVFILEFLVRGIPHSGI